MSESSFDLDIPPAKLESALLQLAVQTGASILFQHEIVEGQTFEGLKGQFGFRDAVDKMLQGRALKYEFLNGTTLVITRSPEAALADTAPEGTSPEAGQPQASKPNGEANAAAGRPAGRERARSARSPAVLEEIMVSARRREESLQLAPVSASVLSGPEMERLRMTSLDEIDKSVPNLSFNTGSSGATTQIFIRGVGQWDTILTTDPGVGMYLDGVYMARAFGNSMDLLELERVEVLRGPQGTLFGKNTTGGAINIITKRPGDTFAAWGKVTYGRYDRLEFQGSLDLPLSDTLKSKISVSKKDQDGYGKRLGTGQDQGTTDSLLARAQLLWTPSERFSMYLSLDVANEDERTLDAVLDDADPFALAPFVAWAVVRPDLLPYDAYITDSRYDNYADSGSSDLDAWGVSATLEWQLSDSLTAKSITAYRDTEHTFGGDTDASPLPIFSIVFGSKQDQFSQELQLLGESFDGRLNWIVGAYYFNEDIVSHDPIGLIPGLFTALENLPFEIPELGAGGPGNPGNLFYDISLDLYNTMDVESVALFGQGSWTLTDQLSLTAGLRYTDESKKYFFSSTHPESGTVSIAPTTRKDDWQNVLGRVGLEYRWNDNLMTYASISTGFKSGGFNGRPQTIEELTSYDEEKVTTYEVGLKSTALEGRLRLNGALFFTEYDDLQLTGFFETDAGFVSLVENAGGAEIFGGELELAWLPVDNLRINFGAGYLDDKITQLDPGVQSVTKKSDLPRTPDWTLNASAEYRLELAVGGALEFGANWHHEGSETAVPAVDPVATVPSYDIFGARIAWLSPSEKWQLALWSTNLTDKKYLIERTPITSFSGYELLRYGRPMEWGVSLKVQL